MKSCAIRFPGIGEYDRDWLDSHEDAAQRLLSDSKGKHPECLCVPQGVPMYIARRQRYYLARMPKTGSQHAVFCPSFEPDDTQCGRGIYSKIALTERPDGHTSVKLDVPISIRPHAGNIPTAATISAASPRETRDAMKLKGLLHLLWEKAGFNRWYPRMRGRRHYKQIFRYVHEAAESVMVRRRELTQYLFIPEPYVAEQKLAIEARRQAAFRKLSQGSAGQAQRIMALGQWRGAKPSEGGVLMELGHMPSEFGIRLDDRLTNQLRRAGSFAWVDFPTIHTSFRMFVLFTMRRAKYSTWECDDLACMVTNEHYVPINSMNEAIVADRLISEDRAFYKPLAFDADPRRYPNFLITDIGSSAIPMEILSNNNDEDALRTIRLAQHVEEGTAYYAWDSVDDQTPPPFPVASIATHSTPSPPPSTLVTPVPSLQDQATIPGLI